MKQGRPFFRRWGGMLRPKALRRSLSAQLLLLTVLFVMISEVLIFIPSIANFRETWLEGRLAAAQIATLALEATPDDMLSGKLNEELLANAEVFGVVLHRDAARRLILSIDMPPQVDAHFDLRDTAPLSLIVDAFGTLFAGDGRTIRIIGAPRFEGGDFIEVIVDETPLRAAMFGYGVNIFFLSLVISVFTASLVFATLHFFLVRPMRNITENMLSFRENPDDARRIIEPSGREDEIGVAERELAAMQHDIRSTLNQRARLASLGSAVSKINHDLRNILASAQLISDRLGAIDDPAVQSLAPRLFASIDRAIELCTKTLRFGRAEEEPPRRRRFALADLVAEIVEALGLADSGPIRCTTEIPDDLIVDADSDHLFRVLLNLGRNAVQALELESRGGEIGIRAWRDGPHVEIEVTDTGPGLPEKAREHLFEAFSGSARSGGTGLGLAISAELVRAHGGDLTLERSGPEGTTFRVCIPDRLAPRLAVSAPAKAAP